MELAAAGGTPTRVRAVVGSLADAEGFDPSRVGYRWESELIPGETGFGAIVRLEGLMGNGDPFEVDGDILELTFAEAALRVRAVAVFKDNAGVFEIARSEPISVANWGASSATVSSPFCRWELRATM